MFFTEWKDQLGEVWMSDISCLILITPDFHWEEQTFIKCEQTNLISVVSKLENLLTKLIFQFYLSLPFSPIHSFMYLYHSFVSSQNLIYYFFSELLLYNISFSKLSICVRLWQESLSVISLVMWQCSICFSLCLMSQCIILYPTSAPFVTQLHYMALHCTEMRNHICHCNTSQKAGVMWLLATIVLSSFCLVQRNLDLI